MVKYAINITLVGPVVWFFKTCIYLHVYVGVHASTYSLSLSLSYLPVRKKWYFQFLIALVDQVSFYGYMVCFSFSRRKPWIYDVWPLTKWAEGRFIKQINKKIYSSFLRAAKNYGKTHWPFKRRTWFSRPETKCT